MNKSTLGISVCAAMLALGLASAVRASPMGTAFTYQGRLKVLGSPATGTYDFRFTLYDVDAAVGLGVVTKEDVQVSNGLFTVELDFDYGTGTTKFRGQALHLELGVRPGNSTGAFTTLSPMQELTPTPYALALPGLWTEWSDWHPAPNLIGGYHGNIVGDLVGGATIGGGGYEGGHNMVSDSYGTVAGGWYNQAGDDLGSAVDSRYATVGGGWENVAGGESSTVSGGHHNIAAARHSTIGGGSSNKALPTDTSTSHHSTIAGGWMNEAYGESATVGGGSSNKAIVAGATVGGGYSNTASGARATVPGGQHNTAAGPLSFAAGYWAKANGRGTFVWADGEADGEADEFASTADNQFLIRASGGVGIGTNEPKEQLDVAGAIRLGSAWSNDTGTIQWTGSDFEGYKEGSWVSLTAAEGVSDSDWTIVYPDMVSAVPGNVGIGTPISPTAKLHVRQEEEADAFRVDDGDDDGMGNDPSPFIIDASGNVGIGGSTPAQKLVVSGGNVGIGYDNLAQTAKLAVNGKVGIGTHSPEHELVTMGTVGIGYNDSGQTSRLAVDGKVSIGLTGPHVPEEPVDLELLGTLHISEEQSPDEGSVVIETREWVDHSVLAFKNWVQNTLQEDPDVSVMEKQYDWRFVVLSRDPKKPHVPHSPLYLIDHIDRDPDPLVKSYTNKLYIEQNRDGDITLLPNDERYEQTTNTGGVGIGAHPAPNHRLHVNALDHHPVAGYFEVTATGEGRSDGVYAKVDGGEGTNVGVNGYAVGNDASTKIGVGALASGPNTKYGTSGAATGPGVNHGAMGYASGIGTNYGVKGEALGSDGAGINYGVHGSASGGTENWAGYFAGDVKITGDLHLMGSFLNPPLSFRIGDPLEPNSQQLSHSLVASPDTMNVYNGNVMLDTNGEARVQLPGYFEALNGDFRYQLTCIGGFAPVYVAEEIAGNSFKIAGGKPGMKISWQVTGIRKDVAEQGKGGRIAADEPAGEYRNTPPAAADDWLEQAQAESLSDRWQSPPSDPRGKQG
ncbi:MAG: hypothetical protein JSU63_19555 [Phycisphaerales bacterium]|nr:MAG: hypothetical protein JSU63_19555 [Phycisphaerales bacterium]